jgi:hypothetical protein
MSFPTSSDSHHFQEGLTTLANKCISSSISLNLYGVSSYDIDDIGLNHWKSLSHLTGGQIHRTTLGYKPDDEIIRLTEMLQRGFSQKYATRCLMKMRASPSLLYSYEQDVSGCLSTSFPSPSSSSSSSSSSLDENVKRIPGIYHLPAVTEDSCFGFKFQVIDPSLTEAQSLEFDSTYYAKQSRNPKKFYFVQLAFNYETLSEKEEDFSTLASDRQGERQGEERRGRRRSETDEGNLDTVNEDGLLIDHSQLIKNICDRFEFEGKNDLPPILNEKDLPISSSSGSSKKSQKISSSSIPSSRYFRHNSSYRHSTSLEVIKQLRVITYGIECESNLQKVESSLILSNAMALLLKENYSKIFSSSEREEQQQQGEVGSEEEKEREREWQSLSSVQKVIKQFQKNIYHEASLINLLVNTVSMKISQLQNDYDFSSFTKDQLFDELFTSSGGNHDLIINNLKNIIFMFFAFLIRSMKFNHSLPSSARNEGQGKKQYSDSVIIYWFFMNYYQPTIIHRMIIPNLVAIEENLPIANIAGGLGSASGSPRTPGIIVVNGGTSSSVASSPVVSTRKAFNKNPVIVRPLSSSAPLQIISDDNTEITNTASEKVTLLLQQRTLAENKIHHQQQELAIQDPSTIADTSSTPPSIIPQFSLNPSHPSTKDVSISLNINSLGVRSQFLPLRRDNMLASGCSLFLLDTGNGLVLYKSLLASANLASDKKGENGEVVRTPGGSVSNKLLPSLLTYLLHRLYEHPLLPSPLLANQGTASSHFFNDYFIEESSNTPLEYRDFLDTLKELTIS